MPTHPHQEIEPRLGERVFIAPTAWVVGDVVLGDDASVWFGSVLRGDVNHIRIGERTNIQDGTVVHVTHETHPTVLGDGVVVGHQAVLHGCTVEDGALVARAVDCERFRQAHAHIITRVGRRMPKAGLQLLRHLERWMRAFNSRHGTSQ